ncbi:uncharacterized protein HMPREF1120_08895 [Exophiala dermatitidis NIH/UT8656]|uniref:Uncharacterized protein n=1 Tax=Exophiala dermatitidis (strain ATCC 34100 / CBS 525.76 / NIH/UT8656) TaxID=858893 RepID=H6CB06_EXODN|nr:uncharacterized protein HMPREF1120_08895 [Exophiala dermatitidis NIH/UT8656]EHY60953.1 hypothetical protein HMPREF1120_08895 [Exophiala dermatitidis NIH/UT8656]
MALVMIEGNWIALMPNPDQSLGTRKGVLEGEDKELLLAFARSLYHSSLTERPFAEDLLGHGFLHQ